MKRRIRNGFMMPIKMNARHFYILDLVAMLTDLPLKNSVIENVVFSVIRMCVIWKKITDLVLEGLRNGEYSAFL